MSKAEHPDSQRASFAFGSTTVGILVGDILGPGVKVDYLVSTDDNYLTMGSGVAGRLRRQAGPEYVMEAQKRCPVQAGTVVDTAPYGLTEQIPTLSRVLHGTVIDYDTETLSLEELVYQTTLNCLERAEQFVREARQEGGRILFPAFATGSGRLSMEQCSRHMCDAIKTYLAVERPLQAIYVILWPGDPVVPEREADIQSYVNQAKLVLRVPYNPTLGIRQTRDVYMRSAEIKRLEAVIAEQVEGKRHAVILGGPRIGKSTLLDQVFQEAHKPGSPLCQNRRLVKVSFGQVHENTPASFIYQKLLNALEQAEQDQALKAEIRQIRASIATRATPDKLEEDAAEACKRFLDFVRKHPDRYPQVVFFVEHMPQLLDMESEGGESLRQVQGFWGTVDKLEDVVRFVYTARDDLQYRRLLNRLSGRFRDRVETIYLMCVSPQERESWINQLYQQYLERKASKAELEFVDQQAGYHPYLISLVGYALIETTQRGIIRNPKGTSATARRYYTKRSLGPIFRQARLTIDPHRRAFFDRLVEPLDQEHLIELELLARAVAIEEEKKKLLPDIEAGDPNAKRRYLQLEQETNPRAYLHQERLRELQSWGYLVDSRQPGAGAAKPVETGTAHFVAAPFRLYVQDWFRTHRGAFRVDRPKDLVITLLRGAGASAAFTSLEAAEQVHPESDMIWTMFRGWGARMVTAQKPLLPETKAEFMASFGQCLNHQLYPVRHSDPGVFHDLEDVGSYIMTQFTTVAIRQYLQELPQGSTVLLMVDDGLKDIPWELMLETAYAGEIPFRAGRILVSQEQFCPIVPPTRRATKIKALLVGDPTDDLEETRREVEWLAQRLNQDDRFAEPDVLVGSEECQRIRILNRLGSGDYQLVHYSGHTYFDGERSAWQLKGHDITTDLLTNALQMAPPALVFSSSCQSAAASDAQEVRYENQTFDLPSAFLQAGVEAYIGTLWNVVDTTARQFVEEFYSALLNANDELGECLRRAKWACKQTSGWQDRSNWLAFVLYGDPHTRPGDLFPAMSPEERP